MTTRGEEIERQYQEAEGDDFKVYRTTLMYSAVCSSLGDEETVRRMQSLPSGTTQGYALAEMHTPGSAPFAPVVAGGSEPNPWPCDKWPDTHKHYLFEA
jgi:hypothetical protein